jgi:SMC interacting uncharacterized protein involved in chromosome segregation
MKERDDLAVSKKQLEEAFTKSVQQFEEKCNNLAHCNKKLEEAFTKSVQQFEKERDDLVTQNKQLAKSVEELKRVVKERDDLATQNKQLAKLVEELKHYGSATQNKQLEDTSANSIQQSEKKVRFLRLIYISLFRIPTRPCRFLFGICSRKFH